MLFYTCKYTSWPWGGQRFSQRDGPEPHIKRSQILLAEGAVGCGDERSQALAGAGSLPPGRSRCMRNKTNRLERDDEELSIK